MIIFDLDIDIKKSDKNMFISKTARIKNIVEENLEIINEMDNIFGTSSRIYIDYANVRPWSEKLGWHIDIKRLKQFLDSFDVIKAVNFYSGYLDGNEQSKRDLKDAENQKYFVRTKPVKIMRFPIKASTISKDSTAILDNFIRRALLRKYEIGTIEYLNERFGDMNKKGEYYIEDRKCNFDVEISTDMILDFERNEAETFILWSGDSDFTDTIEKLLKAGKRVVLFATVRKVSKELSSLVNNGLFIFDIQKIRNFICWKKEIECKRGHNEVVPKL